MSENYSEYDGLMDDLEKDTRIGDQDFLVSNVTTGKWSDLVSTGSDDPYVKVDGVLLTAGQAKVDFTWSPPPAASVVKAEMTSWEPGKRKAVAQAINLAKKLIEYYGKTVEDLKQGDVLRVKTVKTAINKKTGKGGFIRVVAVLPKEQIGQASKDAAVAASEIPF